ncbi:siderophore-interacting protein [Rhodoferax sp. GW822-FHT02A01]|uniref:siderophore-interacting protein n=1 Tax=Rhodoferax sp. GW822-FHT02A01 TaxID=3141537 RepID=UPI00315C97B1
MTIASPLRRIQRVRHELLRRDVHISRIEAPSPGFLSLTFASESLHSFVSLSFDDHVKLIIPDRNGATAMRDFTPTHINTARGELTLEFALHAHGAACEWARQARVGDAAVIGGPKGSMIVPTDYDWHLLAGDASALPAIRRRLLELPTGSTALVFAQIADPLDRQLPTSRSAAQVHWLTDARAWVDALRNTPLPAGEGFVWCAGEASVMVQAREVLINGRQLPREASRISAYWKAGAADFHETL